MLNSISYFHNSHVMQIQVQTKNLNIRCRQLFIARMHTLINSVNHFHIMHICRVLRQRKFYNFPTITTFTLRIIHLWLANFAKKPLAATCRIQRFWLFWIKFSICIFFERNALYGLLIIIQSRYCVCWPLNAQICRDVCCISVSFCLDSFLYCCWLQHQWVVHYRWFVYST